VCWDTEDRLHKPCISHYHSCCLSKKQSPKLQECEDACIWNRSGAVVNCVWGVLLFRHCFCYLRVDWKKVLLALPKKWPTNFSTFPISHLMYILVFARFYFLIMMWISHTFYFYFGTEILSCRIVNSPLETAVSRVLLDNVCLYNWQRDNRKVIRSISRLNTRI
jgi:hypothetical protein